LQLQRGDPYFAPIISFDCSFRPRTKIRSKVATIAVDVAVFSLTRPSRRLARRLAVYSRSLQTHKVERPNLATSCSTIRIVTDCGNFGPKGLISTGRQTELPSRATHNTRRRFVHFIRHRLPLYLAYCMFPSIRDKGSPGHLS